jgi:hypothetical protein
LAEGTIRYSFANAKQLHIDIYKGLMVELVCDRVMNSKPLHIEECAQLAFTAAESAVDLLEDKKRIFKEARPL